MCFIGAGIWIRVQLLRVAREVKDKESVPIQFMEEENVYGIQPWEQVLCVCEGIPITAHPFLH